MSNVIAFPTKKEPQLYVTGEAKCLNCKHKWDAVVDYTNDEYEVNPLVELECPSCGTMRGVMNYNFRPQEGSSVFVCNCSNAVFFVTKTGVLCAGCGMTTSYAELAE